MANDYCEVSDVQAKVPVYAGFTIDSTTKPTDTAVGLWIVEAEAEVNAVLKARGYSAPATGTNDVIMIRGKVASKVALLTLINAFGFESLSPATVEILGGWREFIKSLRNGELSLADETFVSSISVVTVSRNDAYGDVSGTEYT